MEFGSLVGGVMFCLGIAVLLLGIWADSIIVAFAGIVMTFAGYAVGVLIGGWQLARR